jgi:cytochrome c peroxidase
MRSKPLSARDEPRVASALALSLLCAACGPQAPAFDDEAALGRALFKDTSLSLERTQSCATCHDPLHGFIDARHDDDGVVSAVSLGDDGVSLGDRNAPTVAYAALTPAFHVGARQRVHKGAAHRVYEGPLGGFFHDGRAATLHEQAMGPPLNPIEMAMPDRATVVARIIENEDYARGFVELYGEGVFDDDDTAYGAMAAAFAAFESTDEVSPFDSRYDRSLRGDVELTFMELTGKAVFFSQFANCAICHQLHSEGDPVNERREPFTGSEFHNIGVPVNEAVRARNGVTTVDLGLFGTGLSSDGRARGAFKTPTLRNVAVTGPYMHNGVFKELRTVVLFYDHFVNDARAVNPETGLPWAAPEVAEGVATELLEASDPLTDSEVTGLVCFMRALTDARYEHLLDEDVECE